MNNRQFNTIA